MMAQNIIEAYHGTTIEAAESIQQEQHFRESSKDNEWLGTGIYFFPYLTHAEQWIKLRKYGKGAVLTVQLEFDDSELLDLDDPKQRMDMNAELAKLDALIRTRLSVSLPAQGKDIWKQWCLGCNLYRELHPEIGITSYTFPQGTVGISGFYDNQRQLCVSKHEIITEIA